MKILLGCYLLVQLCLASLNVAAVNDLAQVQIKQAFQNAVDSNSVEKINEFIEEYKYTGWELKAVYYRDKAALDAAKRLGTVESLDLFLKTYPHSDWYNLGIHYRDKAAYGTAKSLNTLQAYDQFVEKYPNSRWNKNIASLKKKLVSKVGQAGGGARKKGGSRGDAVSETLTPQQRTNNALKIYAEIEAKKQKAKKIKATQEKKRLAKERRCYKLKDKLRKYSERRVWYKLDDKGERTFLTQEEIMKAKERVSSKYKNKCVN